MLHLGMNKKQARARSAELLAMVGIPNPKDRLPTTRTNFRAGCASV